MAFDHSDQAQPIDDAFAGNRLLSALSGDARQLLEPTAQAVELAVGEVLFDSGEALRSSIFPVGPTTVSLLVDLEGGRSVEVASIGHEGAIGGIVSCGHAPAFARAEVQVGGPALKISLATLENAKSGSRFIGNLFCRYSDYLLAQVMQSAACNAFHSIEQRAARWLLTSQDRSGDRLRLTQEQLARLLGAQRTTVNAVVRSFQDEGLITIRRGGVEVADRAGLHARSCECYDRIDKHFDDVIGSSGMGSKPDEDCS